MLPDATPADVNGEGGEVPQGSRVGERHLGGDGISGSDHARTLNLSVAGLPIVLAREFATDETEDAIVTNRMACGWLEDGPRFAQAEVAANLGREVAIYGYATFIPYISGGIVSIYNQA